MSRIWAEVLILSTVAACICGIVSGFLPHELLKWENMNVWYDSDLPRVLQNMVIREEGHETTHKHPLFPLLTWPPTQLAVAMTGDGFTGIRMVLALNAALFVGLLIALLNRAGVARLDRCLIALLGVSSAAFMFWFTVPETFPFGATSILAALWATVLVKQDSRLLPPELVLVGVVTFAVTITNIAVFAIALAVGLWSNRHLETIGVTLQKWTYVMGAVVLVTAVLAILQDQVFGNAGLFFNIFALLGERQFVGQEAATATLARPGIIFLGTFVASDWVAAPTVNVLSTGSYNITRLQVPVYALQEGTFGGAQMISLGLLAVLGASTAWMLAKFYTRINTIRKGHSAPQDDVRYPLTCAAAASLLAFVILHLIYGAEVFLYVAHFLPLMLVLLGMTMAQLDADNSRTHVAASGRKMQALIQKGLRGVLTALVIFGTAYNGWAVLRAFAEAEILSIFTTATPKSATTSIFASVSTSIQ